MKHKIIVLIIILAVFGASFTSWKISYDRINKRYPECVENSCELGETLKSYGLEYTPLEYEILTFNEFKEKYGDTNEVEEFKDFDNTCFNFIVINLKIKNIGKESKDIKYQEYIAGTLETCNGYNVELENLINKDMTKIKWHLEPNEQTEIKLSYSLICADVTGKWGINQTIKDKPIQLVISLYPVKNVIYFNKNK